MELRYAAMACVLWGGACASLEQEQPSDSGRRALPIAGRIEIRAIEGPRGLAPSSVHEHRVLESGARFVKLRFGVLELSPGDTLSILDGQGRRVEEFRDSRREQWALSVSGDVAVVRLETGHAHGRRGYLIDRVGVGARAVAPLEVGDSLQQASICGQDDKRASACLSDESDTFHDPDKAAAARSVARLLLLNDGVINYCTGSLVSPNGHLLTNEHCVGRAEQAATIEIQFQYRHEACDTNGAPEAVPEVSVNGATLIKNSSFLDYALIQPNENKAPTFGWLPIAPVNEQELELGQQIYLPQHPDGRPQEVAAWDSVTADWCRIRKLNQSIGGYIPQTNVGYTCDTEPGSSGSPVLSADSHTLVALHHLGGCFNNGVYMRDVYPHIADWVPHPGGGTPGDTPEPVPDVEISVGDVLEELEHDSGFAPGYFFTVPPGVARLEIRQQGGSGDADLHVRWGEQPTATHWDYRPFRFGNNELVTILSPTPGDWFVRQRAYSAYSGVTLSISAESDETAQGASLASGESVVLGGSEGSARLFRVDVPLGTAQLDIATHGGTGDSDLYVRRGEPPSKAAWDQRPFRWGSDEAVSVAAPREGAWYVLVVGWEAFRDVTLSAVLVPEEVSEPEVHFQ